MDEAFDAHNRDGSRPQGPSCSSARHTRASIPYWPGAADAPADPNNRALSDDNRALSREYNGVEKVVVTDSYTPTLDNPWHNTTTRIPRDQVAAWIAQARQA